MRRLLDRLRLRIRSLLHGADVNAALRDEIRVHLEEEIDALVAGGMSRSDARAAARRAFGPMDLVEEQCRDTRRVALVETLARDRVRLRTSSGRWIRLRQ